MRKSLLRHIVEKEEASIQWLPVVAGRNGGYGRQGVWSMLRLAGRGTM